MVYLGNRSDCYFFSFLLHQDAKHRTLQVSDQRLNSADVAQERANLGLVYILHGIIQLDNNINYYILIKM